jgi:hypothetical protein
MTRKLAVRKRQSLFKEIVTVRKTIGSYLRWANQVRVTWEPPWECPSFESELDDSAGSEEIPISQNAGVRHLIKAAREIADHPIWKYPNLPLAKEKSWRGPVNEPLQKLARINMERLQSPGAIEKVYDAAMDCFQQFDDIVSIRRIVRRIVKRRNPSGESRVTFLFDRRMQYRITIIPTKKSKVRPTVGLFFQRFLVALRRCDASRIRRCPSCKRFFFAARYQKMTCSEKCHVAWWRKKHPRRAKAIQIKAEIARSERERLRDQERKTGK